MASNNSPKVSVIIPVYNQQDLVIRAISSVPYSEDVELIVINDGSTDDTAKRIKQYIANTKAPIRFYRNIMNKGVGHTVNRGYSLARGEYVVLLGSDDYFYPNKFLEAMQYLDGTDLVYFDLELNDGYIWKLNDGTKYGYCGSTKFIRRSFLGDTRNPQMHAREDWYFYHDLMKKSPTETFTNIVVKHYNFPREGSLTWVACNGFK